MDSMDIDIAPDPNNAPDPNKPYDQIIRRFRGSLDGALNNDDDELNFLLFKIARAVPDRTFGIDFDTIEALRMNDLRNLLILGNYDQAAREVLRRCTAGETLRCIA
jgi:hypothetical protein